MISGMFENLFKSKRRREIERDIKIQRSLSLHRQHVAKLAQHERQYMEKARRAKKAGDTQNFRQLCRLIAQTTAQRRAIESQLLHFETLLQTRDRAKLFGEFAKGMKAMSHSIRDTFKDFDADSMMRDLDQTLAQSTQMESAMSMVLDRISSATDLEAIGLEDAISAEEIERLVAEQIDSDSESVDKEIEAGLREIEKRISTKEKS